MRDSITTNPPETWYILKTPEGYCEIVRSLPNQRKGTDDESVPEYWGPFSSNSEALAKRVGLIRARRCQPM